MKWCQRCQHTVEEVKHFFPVYYEYRCPKCERVLEVVHFGSKRKTKKPDSPVRDINYYQDK